MADRSTRQGRLESDGASVRVHGALTAGTVAGLLGSGRAAIVGRAGQGAVLDFAGVTSADSAGLALVVDWLRTARAHQVQVRIEAVPEQLRAIAQICGLEALLDEGGG